MKILVTGSRTINDYAIVHSFLAKHIQFGDVIIHGGALGVDLLVARYCVEHKIKQVVIRPVSNDKISYLYRNVEMVGMCDSCLSIWDGQSRGTKFTIDYAKARNKYITDANNGNNSQSPHLKPNGF